MSKEHHQVRENKMRKFLLMTNACLALMSSAGATEAQPRLSQAEVLSKLSEFVAKKEGEPVTKEMNEKLASLLVEIAKLNRNLTDGQRMALASLAYNVGGWYLKGNMNADGSLSLRGLVAKGDMERARDRVMVYVKVGGAGGRADKCGAAKTQREMNECYGRVLKSADEELNRTFVEVANQVRDPIQKTLVQSSQEAWAAYRVNQCEFQASGVRGGSVYATVLATCMTAQARVRTRDLRSVLNCAEGDLSCPL